MRRFVLLVVAGSLAGSSLACPSNVGDSTGAPVTTSVTAAGPTRWAPRSSARAEPLASRRDTPAVDGGSLLVQLRAGASIEAPPGAERVKGPSVAALPSIVRDTHVFKFGSGKRRLMISEADLEGKACAARLDEEWERLNAATQDTHPTRVQFRQMRSVKRRTVAGHQTIYGESQHRTSAEVDAGKPFYKMAGTMMCEGQNLLYIIYLADAASTASEVQALLDGVVASYRPPKGSE